MDKIDWVFIVDYLLKKENVAKILGTCLAGLVTAYIGKIWYSYQFFKKRGIKTPPYRFFWGNFPELRKNKNQSEVLKKWTETYGKTYGYFEGHLPIMVTSDLEIIEEICVKQYSNFSARKRGPIERKDDAPVHSLFSATRSKWKRMRNIMNPTFSSSKLRELGPLMIMCTDRLIAKLNENIDTEIDVSQFLKRYTMDTIWNCAFGVDTDTQNVVNNPYFEKSEMVFKQTAELNPLLKFGIYFHEYKSLLISLIIMMNSFNFYFISENATLPFFWIRKKITQVYDDRVNQPDRSRRDYLQLLIEAKEYHDKKDNIKSNDKEIKFKELHVEKSMSEQEISMNLVVFLLAGYETTSTTLAYAFHVLATIPAEQEKLINEIDELFPTESDVLNVDNVQKLQYLDMFIKETLRMYPIGNSVVARRCVNPTYLKGIYIPTDSTIAVDVLSLHYDPELWGPEDPNTFYPPRFSPEHKRHPMAFQAFGQGPRNCIGMKFALLEAKVALVKILKNFKIYSTENTSLTYVEGVVRSPKYGVKIMLKKRN